jgi:dihydrofolate synthase/folylpolyglutamate synthase
VAEDENPYFDAVDRDAAEQFLFSRIDYERSTVIPYGKRDFRLDRMVRLMAQLGDPQRELKVVHVAGTKGKGSTAAMIASVLTAAGYRTGLYTSPHLLHVEERLRIDGIQCSAPDFVDLVERIKPVVAQLDAEAAAEDPPSHGPTYFEIITAMALMYFADARVDCAVLEVGLGGRLDSTNICLPAVSVITSISFDHTKQLGSTLAEIAGEKAGIIKSGIPVVSGVVADEPREVIRHMAGQHGCRLVERGIDFDAVVCESLPGATVADATRFNFVYRVAQHSQELCDARVPLAGWHQAENAAVALATIEELRRQHWDIDDAAVRRGLANVECSARVQMLMAKPLVVVDVAHNVASIEALLQAINLHKVTGKRRLIFATTKDKDTRGMLAQLLPQFDDIVLTRYCLNPRSVPVDELAALADLELANFANVRPIVRVAEDLAGAWSLVKSQAAENDLIVVTGSFFIVAELLVLFGEARNASEAIK